MNDWLYDAIICRQLSHLRASLFMPLVLQDGVFNFEVLLIQSFFSSEFQNMKITWGCVMCVGASANQYCLGLFLSMQTRVLIRKEISVSFEFVSTGISFQAELLNRVRTSLV